MAAVNPQVLDSSALRGIQMPDIVGGIEKAYTLKSMMDVNQLNNLKMNAENRQLQDQETARNILKDSDLSTVDGAYKAAQKLTKAGMPKQGMDIVNTVQSVQSGRYELEDKQLKIHADTQTLLDHTVGSVLASIQPMAEAKKPDGSPMYERSIIDQNAETALGNAISNLKNDKSLPEDVKNLALEQVKKYVGSGQPITFESLQKVYGTTKEGVAAIKAHMEQRQGIADLTKTEADIKLKGAETRAADERAKTLAASGETGNGLDPATIKSMAERVVIGGEPLTAVAGRLGSGTQGRRDLRDLQNEIARISAERGIGPGGVVAQRQETAAQGKASQVAGAQAGRVAVGLAEVRQFGPLAIQASDAIPRGNFTPLSKLTQLGESKISDVNQKVFLVRHQAFLNAYNLVASRAGISASDRDHNRSLLEMADSPEAYKAGAQAIMFEAEQAEQAAQSAMKVPRAGAPAPAAASSGGPKEGDTASGPGGAKVRFSNGAWVKM